MKITDLSFPRERSCARIRAIPFLVSLDGALKRQGNAVLLLQPLQVLRQLLLELPSRIRLRHPLSGQAFLEIKEKASTFLDPQGLDDSVEEPANVQIASDLGIVTDGGEIEVLQHGPDEGERPGVWLKPSQG